MDRRKHNRKLLFNLHVDSYFSDVYFLQNFLQMFIFWAIGELLSEKSSAFDQNKHTHLLIMHQVKKYYRGTGPVIKCSISIPPRHYTSSGWKVGVVFRLKYVLMSQLSSIYHKNSRHESSTQEKKTDRKPVKLRSMKKFFVYHFLNHFTYGSV